MDSISAAIGGTRQDKAKADKIKVENIMKASQTHLVVATLLVTVTFAAGFTLPGGFDSDTDSPNKWIAILLRKAVFQAFVVTDSIAFACSTDTMFMYFIMAKERCSPSNNEQVFSIIWELYNHVLALQLLAMFAAVIAFVSGMYATLAHSAGLAVTICVIGCTSFLVYFWVYCRAFRNNMRMEQRSRQT
ncbi:hypothetical protein K7X08_030077 [Anisodus acutangulus]|uniref:PGG domain-containing protein n=1 Tax=Anisodus acutangulus TaxID=402998 RepID=A0A9Q1R572_9SOLA|nr:hypothetical protein K7X08_030077 [Anisodus acutangulus]